MRAWMKNWSRPERWIFLTLAAALVVVVAGYTVLDAVRIFQSWQLQERHSANARALITQGLLPQARTEMERSFALKYQGDASWSTPPMELPGLERFKDGLLARAKVFASVGLIEEDLKLWAETLGREGFKYIGSRKCLACHSNLHRNHVETWRNGKMAKAFDRIRDLPNNESCLPCHTTGYNPITKKYSEEGVACEACHGPGEKFAWLMQQGRTAEGGRIALGNVRNDNPCARCHSPKRVPHARKAF